MLSGAKRSRNISKRYIFINQSKIGGNNMSKKFRIGFFLITAVLVGVVIYLSIELYKKEPKPKNELSNNSTYNTNTAKQNTTVTNTSVSNELTNNIIDNSVVNNAI